MQFRVVQSKECSGTYNNRIPENFFFSRKAVSFPTKSSSQFPAADVQLNLIHIYSNVSFYFLDVLL